MPPDETRRAEVYERYQEWIFKFFLGRGFSREDAEDLKQDAFVRVFSNMDDLRSEQAATVWIQRVTASIWKNEIRRKHARKRTAIEVSLDAAATVDGTPTLEIKDPSVLLPDEKVLSREQAELVREEVAALPDQMRRCLEAYEVNGLKYREIAVDLGIEINTVKSHIFQARRKLKERLELRWKPKR